ncbi:alanine--tRNA ligase, partial [Escherichia coli]|nr:alanine--tRNA ligase [Escherichia coli]
IGFRKPFMAQLLDTLIKIMGGHYTELVENKNFIKEQLTLEEDRFFKTIDLGMSLFNEELANTKEIFSGEIAFKLYDTYGFPLDLTEDMLRDKGLKVDLAKFDELMNAQKAMAKAAWKGSGDASNDGDFKQLIEKYGINEFVGYENITYKSKIVA